MSIEDRLAILDAMARYSYAFDKQDPELWTDLFLASGVFEVFVRGAAQPATRYAGYAELHGFAVDSFTRRLLGARVRHFQTNTLFQELSADAARTSTMVLITQVGSRDEHPRLALTGQYEDVWSKRDAQWKLAVRTLRTD